MPDEVIPIDPKTGKPREGKWLNGRTWIPEKPVLWALPPQSNPNFDINFRFRLTGGTNEQD